MNKNAKTVLYIVLFIISILAAGYAYKYLSDKYKPENQLSPNNTAETSPTTSPQNSDSQVENQDEPLKAADFVVLDASGKEVRLSDYEGTPVVLNFWASWCSPCKNEMPHFNKVSEEYSKDELIFLMVDLVDGQRETVESGKQFIEDSGYTFTVLYDTNQDAAITYGVRSIPSTLFISKDGTVEAGIEGSIDEKTLRLGIETIYPG